MVPSKKKPVVGVIGNSGVINDRHNVQLVGQRNMRAVADVAGALPLMFAGTPDITDIEALLGAVDGGGEAGGPQLGAAQAEEEGAKQAFHRDLSWRCCCS